MSSHSWCQAIKRLYLLECWGFGCESRALSHRGHRFPPISKENDKFAKMWMDCSWL